MSKVVYYNQAGGAVLAALEKADADYEQSLRDQGIKFRKDTFPDGQVPAADQLQNARVRPDKDGKARMEVDS